MKSIKSIQKIVKEFNCEHLGIIYNVNIGHAAPMGLLPSELNIKSTSITKDLL